MWNSARSTPPPVLLPAVQRLGLGSRAAEPVKAPPLPGTIPLVSTTDSDDGSLFGTPPGWLQLVSLLVLVVMTCQGCAVSPWLARRSAGPTGGLGQRVDRLEPTLSGNGQWLASLILLGGRPTLLLQEQPSGRRVPLPNLRGRTPHRSPSISWNGRYLAIIVQQGPRRLAVVDDRASGRLHRLQLPLELEPDRLSLAPDARRLAIATVGQGRPQVQLFDLSGLLEPDLPPAQAIRGPANPSPN
jgi:hypothetical protein